MNALDLNNRRFKPVQNSENGTVDDETMFTFSQTGNVLLARYQGGVITEGHIIGTLLGDGYANLLYHCVTHDAELRAGQAAARFSISSAGGMTIAMDWEWLTGTGGKGTSLYKEIL